VILVVMAVLIWPKLGLRELYFHPAYANDQAVTNLPDQDNFVNPKLLRTLSGHQGTVKSLTFTPNSKILVSGGADNEGIIRFWDVESGRNAGNIGKAHQTAVESVVVTTDGQTLISCSSDSRINLWDLKSLKFNRSLVGHNTNVLALAVSPDNKVLASGGLDGIRLWDLQQQRPLATLVRFDNFIYTLAISPDGQTLASGDGKGVIKLWSLSSGKLIRRLVAHQNMVTALEFTANSQFLVSSSRDRTIKIWNIPTGARYRTLTGHNNWVNAIALHPHGQTLASGGKDGIKLWDLTTGELKNTLTAHDDWVSTLAFSADGKILASGGFDQKIKLWGR
jgi:WD40 repeat protein